MSMDSLRAATDAAGRIAALPSADQKDAIKVWNAAFGAFIDEIKNNASIAAIAQAGISINGPASIVVTQGATTPSTGKIS